MKGIILIGFMGTGKTVVGRRLAERLGLNFIDTDGLIEDTLGMSIERIFEQHGEPYFRKIEKEVVASISRDHGLVVATGGGVVLDGENVANLKRMGTIIHLSAGPDVILERTRSQGHRPLLQTEDAKRRIENLLDQRAPLYAVADLEIDTSELGFEDIVERILRYLQESENGSGTG
jgi:shikimate kinase